MSQQINLYTRSLLKEEKHFSAVTMLQALAVLLGAGLAFYGYTFTQLTGLEKIAADGASQLKEQTARLAALTRELSPQGKSQQLEEELARTNARLARLEELSTVMRTGGMANTSGYSKYLAAFARQSMSGVWLTSISIGGDESSLALGGRVLHADLVPAYMKMLRKEEVMRGRRISDLRLSAREEQKKLAMQAPGTSPTEAGESRNRYVEFNLTAVRGSAADSAPVPHSAGGPAAGKDMVTRLLEAEGKAQK